jgi:hypothetical protein
MPRYCDAVETCATRAALTRQVDDVVARVVELIYRRSAAIEYGHENTVMVIDRQIEHSLGEKERAIGALLQHRKEHGC